MWSFIVLPQECSELQPWKYHSVNETISMSNKRCAVIGVLTEETVPLTDIHRQMEVWRKVFQEFVVICIRFSSNMTIQGLTRPHRFSTLVSLSWTTQHTSQYWLHPTSMSYRNWRNIWEDITSCQRIKSRQQWTCGSVNKTHSSVVTDSWNYLNVVESVWAAEVIMVRSNYVKLQNEL
jgi:hypothetical protein